MKNNIVVMMLVLSMIFGNINIISAETENSSKIVEAKESVNSQLIWSDEFNGTELNSINWEGIAGSPGYGSYEPLTYYMDCCEVKDGNLVIKPQFQWNKSTQKVVSNSLKSSRIWTKGLCYFKYGKIEIRAKLPKGQGTAPMAWMMGNDNSWPLCGEIDILESSIESKNQIVQSIQCNTYNGMPMSEGAISKMTAIANTTSEYHTYGIIWDEEKITFTIDGVETWVYNPDTYSGSEDGRKNSDIWPFNQPFYFILNCDIGKNYCGTLLPNNWTKIATNGDIETYQDYFYIDYVRVYELPEKETPAPIVENVNKPAKVKSLKAVNVKGKKVKLTWKKVSLAKGYQITYALNKKFTKGKKKIFTKKKKYTIKKLKKKKTYYFKVRAYNSANAKKVYGTFSKVKKVKIKK